MADKDVKRINPDSPRSPGTAPVPDLDVDVEQFRRGEPAPGGGPDHGGQEPPD